MTKLIATLALSATFVACAGNQTRTTTETTTTTTERPQSFAQTQPMTSGGSQVMENSNDSDMYTSDRYDNLDPRTNSKSTPAYVGAENSRLDADVTERESGSSTAEVATPAPSVIIIEEEPLLESEMSGSSTADSWDESEHSEDSRLSGSGTTGTATSGTTPTDTATGTAAASDTSKTKKEMKKSKKTSKASKTETTGTGSTAVGSPSATGSGSMGTTTKESSEDFDRTEASTELDTPDETYNRNDQLSGSATAAGSAAGTSGRAMNTGSDLTAQDTSRNAKEVELVRRIRSEITDTKNLSMRAQNIKVINQNGQIYLKGPVANATEQTKVEQIAKKMAGNTAVINETYVEAR